MRDLAHGIDTQATAPFTADGNAARNAGAVEEAGRNRDRVSANSEAILKVIRGFKALIDRGIELNKTQRQQLEHAERVAEANGIDLNRELRPMRLVETGAEKLKTAVREEPKEEVDPLGELKRHILEGHRRDCEQLAKLQTKDVRGGLLQDDPIVADSLLRSIRDAEERMRKWGMQFPPFSDWRRNGHR